MLFNHSQVVICENFQGLLFPRRSFFGKHQD